MSAFNDRHRLVVTESVTNAHFSFLLRPGRYTISVKTSLGQRAHRSVTAQANTTVHVNFHFAIH